MQQFEEKLSRLVTKSVMLITEAVEQAAERNARLFSEAVHFVTNSTIVRPMKKAELENILKGMEL